MAEIRTCRATGKQFVIQDRDFEFYKKIGAPTPTLCPEERTRRRFSFRNEMHLYRAKCALTKKPIISCIKPDSPYTVYSNEAWWGDSWNATDYGRDFDFKRPFFEQFKDLFIKTPQVALHTTNNENCPYTNYVAECKNCYLINGSVYCEDCYYGNPYYSRSCVDSFLVRQSELCYQCITCEHCYNCDFCHDCVSCTDCAYCYDCHGCQNCFGCAGLRHKQFYIFNKPVAKEKYAEKVKELLKNPSLINIEFEKVKHSVPRRAMAEEKCENVDGDYVYESKNTHYAFDVQRCEDCSYVAQIVDCKDCYDCNYTEENELCYEYIGYYRNTRAIFSLTCFGSNNILYSAYCMNSNNCFGCVGLKRKSYCILNKQYTKEEYEDLIPRIIEHMGGPPASAQREREAEAKPGLVGSRPSKAELKNKEWGEFFPISLSPFPYEDTVAALYFPL